VGRVHYAWVVAAVGFVTLITAAGFRSSTGVLIRRARRTVRRATDRDRGFASGLVMQIQREPHLEPAFA
jgi:hypothetical protein